MRWRILAVILAISLIAGCVGEKPGTEIGKGIDSEKTADKVSTQSENLKIIDSIVFTRTGTQVNLKEEAQVTFANVYNNDTKIASQNVNSKAKDVFIDFNWEPKKQYKIEVQTSNGIASSSVSAPAKPTTIKLGEIKLEETVTPALLNLSTSIVPGMVRFSDDGRYLVIGSAAGYVKIIEIKSMKIIFEKKISEGSIKQIEFTSDARYILIGEQSPDGFIYCFDISTGLEKWRYSTGLDVGIDIAKKPNIYGISADSKGRVFVVAGRAFTTPQYNEYSSKIYSFDAENGNIIWKFPENDSMDNGVPNIEVTPDGKYVAFGTTTWADGVTTKPVKKYASGIIYLLNANDGKILSSYAISPPDYGIGSRAARTTISSDGKFISTSTVDGRAFLFEIENISNVNMKLSWQKNLSTPILVSGIPIYASANYITMMGDSVAYTVGNSYIPSKSRSAKYNEPPIEHPNGATVLVYDIKGDILWKWRLEGYGRKPEISKDLRYLIVPIAQNKVTKDVNIFGVYVFDNFAKGGATSKLSIIYKTQGVVGAADISPDGKYIAAFESPIRADDGTVMGEYKVHILS